MDLGELDLYDDLDEFQEKHDQHSKELSALQDKIKELEQQNENLRTENKNLRSNIKVMKVNFQSLLDTALRDIKRKDGLIAQLRQEKDNICFRRSNITMQQSFESKAQEENGKEQLSITNPFRKQVDAPMPIVTSSRNSTENVTPKYDEQKRVKVNERIEYDRRKQKEYSHISERTERDRYNNHDRRRSKSRDVESTVERYSKDKNRKRHRSKSSEREYSANKKNLPDSARNGSSIKNHDKKDNEKSDAKYERSNDGHRSNKRYKSISSEHDKVSHEAHKDAITSRHHENTINEHDSSVKADHGLSTATLRTNKIVATEDEGSSLAKEKRKKTQYSEKSSKHSEKELSRSSKSYRSSSGDKKGPSDLQDPQDKSVTGAKCGSENKSKANIALDFKSSVDKQVLEMPMKVVDTDVIPSLDIANGKSVTTDKGDDAIETNNDSDCVQQIDPIGVEKAPLNETAVAAQKIEKPTNNVGAQDEISAAVVSDCKKTHENKVIGLTEAQNKLMNNEKLNTNTSGESRKPASYNEEASCFANKPIPIVCEKNTCQIPGETQISPDICATQERSIKMLDIKSECTTDIASTKAACSSACPSQVLEPPSKANKRVETTKRNFNAEPANIDDDLGLSVRSSSKSDVITTPLTKTITNIAPISGNIVPNKNEKSTKFSFEDLIENPVLQSPTEVKATKEGQQHISSPNEYQISHEMLRSIINSIPKKTSSSELEGKNSTEVEGAVPMKNIEEQDKVLKEIPANNLDEDTKPDTEPNFKANDIPQLENLKPDIALSKKASKSTEIQITENIRIPATVDVAAIAKNIDESTSKNKGPNVSRDCLSADAIESALRELHSQMQSPKQFPSKSPDLTDASSDQKSSDLIEILRAKDTPPHEATINAEKSTASEDILSNSEPAPVDSLISSNSMEQEADVQRTPSLAVTKEELILRSQGESQNNATKKVAKNLHARKPGEVLGIRQLNFLQHPRDSGLTNYRIPKIKTGNSTENKKEDPKKVAGSLERKRNRAQIEDRLTRSNGKKSKTETTPLTSIKLKFKSRTRRLPPANENAAASSSENTKPKQQTTNLVTGTDDPKRVTEKIDETLSTASNSDAAQNEAEKSGLKQTEDVKLVSSLSISQEDHTVVSMDLEPHPDGSIISKENTNETSTSIMSCDVTTVSPLNATRNGTTLLKSVSVGNSLYRFEEGMDHVVTLKIKRRGRRAPAPGKIS